MNKLLAEIRKCTVCEKHLQFGANPIITASKQSKIVIIGQAPGRIVHQTGIPWNDKSGDRLREWMDIDKEIFYDAKKIALVPMGFCYPGNDGRSDLPPRPECAPLWHHKLLSLMKERKMILLVGQYAQNYYLKEKTKTSLTETVRAFKDYLPEFFPLPHPSPRNNIWQAKNKWFGSEVLPVLKKRIQKILGG